MKQTLLLAISLCRTDEAVAYVEPLRHLLNP